MAPSVPRPVVYRSTARLEQLDLITAAEDRTGNLGPARVQLATTAKGVQAARDWLYQPVLDPCDIGSGLLIKLVLLGRIDSDPRELLRLQRAQREPIADALAVEGYAATGYDHTLALWRYESVAATLRFLDALLATAPAR